MDKNSMFKHLKKYKIFNKEEYFSEAFSRNIGLLTKPEQMQLSHAKVAIPGMGGVGSIHLITMVRSGVGKFNIADFDSYEPANINRQFGARVLDFGRSKAEVMAEQAFAINPYVDISCFREGINESNIDEFLDGVDVVLDGLDFFQFEIRRRLFKKAAEKGIYVITAGPMGYSSAMLVFSPSGMGFDEYFNITEELEDEDKYLAFALGLSPSPTHARYMDFRKVDFSSKAGPSLNIACQICAGMASTEAIRIILGKPGIKSAPYYCQFDPYLMKLKKGRLFFGNRNPIQKLKMKIVRHMLNRNKTKNFRKMPNIPEMTITGESIPKTQLNFLIEAGIQAPSGDNVQPWFFKILNTSIYIYLDKAADNSFFNVNQIASIISCGTVIENMVIAASQLGLETQVSYLPEKNEAELMARLDLKHKGGEVKKDFLFHSIWRRNTNRKFYKTIQVRLSDLKALQQKASIEGDIKIEFIIQKDKLKSLAKIIYQTDRIRTMNRSLHGHLNRMIRFSYQDMINKKDGFPIKNLEAGLAGELFLRATKSWKTMNILNKTGISRLVALHSYQGIMKSSGVMLLSIDGFSTESFLKGGRALERLWLSFTQAGYSVQPMTAITLFWLRWIMNGEKEFEPRSRALLKNTWEQFQNLFPNQDMHKRGLIMLFRFGISAPLTMGTLRKDIQEFISHPTKL